jgi:hypothetical protein
MNRLPASSEIAARRPDWIEGEWITLADGEAWSFPPTEAIPGYQEAARKACRVFVDNILALLNIDAIHRAGKKAKEGDPSDLLLTIVRMFALYQIVFFAGSALLKRNYFVTDADCERLMPFNYQATDLVNLHSRLHQATPEVLAISNAVARISGIDVGPELARITTSN